MSSRRSLIHALAFVWCLSQVLTPSATHAQEKDRGPQGNQQITQLPNGLTATTTAQVDQNGLQSTTTVQIPVAGVNETRVDYVQDTHTRRPSTTPGQTKRASGPPVDIPPPSTITRSPSGSANQIVFGGPVSCETGGGLATNCFGGGSIGGFDFTNTTPDTATPGGQTTAWRAVGQVIRLDPRALALNVQHELGFPPIELKANPNPGLAQLESWFWAINYDGQVRTRTGTQSETHTECRLNAGILECEPVTTTITVDVRQTPRLYAWDFGDDRTARDGHPAAFTSSQGLGRPYSDPNSPSHVQHKYVLSSLKFVDAGGFPITLNVTWDAEFRVNGGAWQDLGPVTGTFTSRHQVRESWPVGVTNTRPMGTTP